MASLNKRVTNTFTAEGAPARTINPLAALERSVMSCLLWEDEFYEDGVAIADRIKKLVTEVDAKDVADLAIKASKEMRLRHVPLLLARELARTKEGKAELKRVFPIIINRADQITEFLAMYWSEGKIPLAKQVKKHLGDCFRSFDEYQLAKYNGGKKSVKLRDALRILRPKPKDDAEKELWRKLVKDELSTPDTWEVQISKAGIDFKTQEEKSVAKKNCWERLLNEGKLGGLALLRNLRNMNEAGVSGDEIKAGINKLLAGRLLPINFIASANYNPQFEAQLEEKFFECFNTRPKDDASTIILIDVSGSMEDRLSGRSEMKRLDVACSLAMIGREMFNNVRIFTFSHNSVEVPARRGFGLKDAIINSQQHGGTNLGEAVKNMPECDRLIVITDEQSHDSVPDRKGYMINVASNKNGVGYGQWTHIDGWSDKVLNYIITFENQR